MKAKYTSVWDNGTRCTTDCEYDPNTKTVTDIEYSDADIGDAGLEREFVQLPDGTEAEPTPCLNYTTQGNTMITEQRKTDAIKRAEMLLDEISTALKNGDVQKAAERRQYIFGFIGAMHVVGILDDDEFCAFRDSIKERCAKD